LAVEVPLQGPGWNIFAYAIAGEGKPVADALKTIAGLYTAVYAYEPTSADPWRIFDPTAPDWVNDLKQLEYGKSYLIYATQPTILHPAAAFAATAALAPPAVVYGDVQRAGKVTAWIDGRSCGESQTVAIGAATVFVVEVASDANARGCGAPDRTIRFTLDGAELPATIPWDNTQAAELISGVGDTDDVYLPYVKR
jgi:hypothetical protein